MCHFRQAVDTHVDGVEPGRRRKLDNEIHGHRLPPLLRRV
jgi:hypothetical protein